MFSSRSLRSTHSDHTLHSIVNNHSHTLYFCLRPVLAFIWQHISNLRVCHIGGKHVRVAQAIILTQEQKARLEAYTRGRSIARRLVERARIVLLAAEGSENLDIAEKLQISRHTVARWRIRFAHCGMAGIEKDAPDRAVRERSTATRSFG